MARISSLPPELILQVLSYLPVRSLIAFSTTSRFAHDFAKSSLHTLALGIYPNRVASLIGRLKSNTVAGPPPPATIPARESGVPSSQYNALTCFNSSGACSYPCPEDYTFSVMIPQDDELPADMAFAFHNALTVSILSRYRSSLRNLELTIWSLTPALARALASVKSVRRLTLRIQNPYVRQDVHGRWILASGTSYPQSVCIVRDNDRISWNELAGAWGQLETLRLEGAAVTDWQFVQILKNNPWIRELWLEKCPMLSRELWSFMGAGWQGKQSLAGFGFVNCASEFEEDDLELLDGLTGLKYLSLLSTPGLQNDAVSRRNEEKWHIKNLTPPQSVLQTGFPEVIEVDPLYEDDGIDYEI